MKILFKILFAISILTCIVIAEEKDEIEMRKLLNIMEVQGKILENYKNSKEQIYRVFSTSQSNIMECEEMFTQKNLPEGKSKYMNEQEVLILCNVFMQILVEMGQIAKMQNSAFYENAFKHEETKQFLHDFFSIQDDYISKALEGFEQNWARAKAMAADQKQRKPRNLRLLIGFSGGFRCFDHYLNPTVQKVDTILKRFETYKIKQKWWRDQRAIGKKSIEKIVVAGRNHDNKAEQDLAVANEIQVVYGKQRVQAFALFTLLKLAETILKENTPLAKIKESHLKFWNDAKDLYDNAEMAKKFLQATIEQQKPEEIKLKSKNFVNHFGKVFPKPIVENLHKHLDVSESLPEELYPDVWKVKMICEKEMGKN